MTFFAPLNMLWVSDARRVWVLLVLLLLSACSPQPKSDSEWLKKAESAEREGNRAAAMVLYRNAIQAAPASPDVRFAYGQALLRQGDVQAAQVEISRALELGLDKETGVPALANAQFLSGDLIKVVRSFGDVQLKSAEAQSQLLATLASAWGSLRDLPRATSAASAAMAAAPDADHSKLAWARALANGGDVDGAMRIAESVTSANASSQEAWLLLGQLKMLTGNASEAEAIYRKAIAVNAQSVPARAGLIGAMASRDDRVGMAEELKALEGVAPSHPTTDLLRAQIAYLNGNDAVAKDKIQQLLRVFPDHLPTLVLAGLIELRTGSPAAASRHFGKALAAAPELVRARLGLAEAELKMGQPARAQGTLKPLLDRKPPETLALAISGDAYIAAGDNSSAERRYRQAAAQDKGNIRLQVRSLAVRIAAGDQEGGIADLRDIVTNSRDVYALRALFAAQLARRDFSGAGKALDELEAALPVKTEALELRGRLMLAQGRVPETRAAFERLLETDPKSQVALVHLVALDVREGKHQEAIKRLQATVQKQPSNMPAYVTLADLKMRTRAPTGEVRAALEGAIRADPAAAAPHVKLIEFNLRRRLYKDALAAAHGALAARADDPEILRAAAQAQVMGGELEQALKTYRTLAAVLPNSAEAYLSLAQIYSNQQNYESAETAVKKALDIEPESEQALAAYAALLQLSAKREAAIAQSRKIQSQLPTRPIGYLIEASLHLRSGDRQAATAVMQLGLQRTGSSEIASRLYNHYMETDRAAEARAFAATWLRQNPKDAGFEYQLAARDIMAGNFKVAEERLRRVVAAEPRSAVALQNLAWVLLQSKNPAATEYAARAVEVMPESPPMLEILGATLAMQGKWGEAAAVLGRAVELSPEDPDLRLDFAQAAVEAGEKAMARVQLRELSALGDKFKKQAEVAKLQARL